MQQRGKAGNALRLCAGARAQHVFLYIVCMVFGPLCDAGPRRDLRQHSRKRLRFRKGAEPVQHAFSSQSIAYIGKEQLVKLLPHAFCRNVQNTRCIRPGCSKRARFHGKTKLRGKARHAQHAQAIVPQNDVGVR